MTTSTFSFHCTACGRCCNSAPAMTVDELFHHQQLFIGCLALRRDAQGALQLSTQGHDYPSLPACRALDAQGLCSVHDDRKPGMCSVVPLDPRLPAAWQPVVLQRRIAEAAYLGAECLAAGPREGHAPLIEGDRIVDAGYASDHAAHQVRLAEEDARWGQAVRSWIRPLLPTLAVPRDGGFIALSLVPVLMALADESAEQRARCLGYAQSQAALIDRRIAEALQRRIKTDRPFTEELRRLRGQYVQFAQTLRA